jgi:accessory gene regulator protein AgrB
VEGPSKSDELWTEIVEKMKYEFEITKKNIKKVAIDYAVNYFKEKSFELSNLYT